MKSLEVTYHIAAVPDEARSLAESVLLDQTVEVPVEVARQDAFVREEMMGRLLEMMPAEDGGTLARTSRTSTRQVPLGEAVHRVAPFDLVHVPAQTWHQFRAEAEALLGFLCLVDCRRDRLIRPDENEAAALRRHPDLGFFVRLWPDPACALAHFV